MRIRSLAMSARFAVCAASLFSLSLSFSPWSAAQAQTAPGNWAGTGAWKNSTGLCWRSGYWTREMATAECDPDLLPKPAPVAPPAPVVVAPRQAPPPPAAPPAPPKPRALNVTLTEQFASNKATLTPQLKARLDREVVAKLGEFSSVGAVRIEGHTDRLGSAQYNQKLSEKRAEAVGAYLISKGVDKEKVSTLGWGKIYPVKSCPDQKNRKALNECLAPNRRVTVEVTGTPK